MEGLACIKASSEVEVRFNVTPVIPGIESNAVNPVFHAPLVVPDPITHDPAEWSPLLNEKIKAIPLYGQRIGFPPKPVFTVYGAFD